MLVEEPTVPSTHMMITDHPSFSYANSSEIFEAIHKSTFINPIWKRPMFFRNNCIIAFRRCQILGTFLEFICKRFIIKEYPRILALISNGLIVAKKTMYLVFPIPAIFKLLHALPQTNQLRISNKTDQSSSRSSTYWELRQHSLRNCIFVVSIFR